MTKPLCKFHESERGAVALRRVKANTGGLGFLAARDYSEALARKAAEEAAEEAKRLRELAAKAEEKPAKVAKPRKPRTVKTVEG